MIKIPEDEAEFIDIPGFEGLYQINQKWEIRSLDRIVGRENTSSYKMKGRIMRQCKNTRGYLMVRLSKSGEDKMHLVSRLLALTFIPNPNNYPYVRHLNDVKTDNRLINLAWGTRKDNAQDSIRNGTKNTPKGEKHHWYGHKNSPPCKGLRGEDIPHTKIILDLLTGIYYYGLMEAAQAKSINRSTLAGKLNGHIKNNTSLIYT